jgi:hypothetical protein
MGSAVSKRMLDLGTDIANSPAEELAFQHSILAQTCLPASRPPQDLLLWERRQGRSTLLIEAGKAINPRSGRFEQLCLPYGPKARLLLVHLNSEAIRSRSPVIPVEETMTAFFRRLMGRTQDGRQANMLKIQLSSLAAAQFRLGIICNDRSLQVNTQIVHAFNLWFEKDENQRILWPATLTLSLDYYESLSRFAVPLDERAIAALAHSAIALDIYCWLAQRLHRIGGSKPQLVSWLRLHEQFGQGYSRIRKFREFFLSLLPQIHSAYPDARFEVDCRGMSLSQSPPPVRKQLICLPSINVQSGAADAGSSQ